MTPELRAALARALAHAQWQEGWEGVTQDVEAIAPLIDAAIVQAVFDDHRQRGVTEAVRRAALLAAADDWDPTANVPRVADWLRARAGAMDDEGNR